MALPELLVSCVLCAVGKPSGGSRPIAMGEAFYKLSCLYALSLVGPTRTCKALGPIQFALSPGGPESALHVLQSAVELHPDWVIVSTDISNAFNSRRRDQILSELFQSPDLSPLYRLSHWSYGSDSPLLLMNRGKLSAEFASSEGVRQGDPLGSLLFSLSMRNTYSNAINNLDCNAVAVMDDIYFFGLPDPTLTAFDRFITSLPEGGLSVNLPKSIAFLPDNPSDLLISEFTDRNLLYSTESIPALGSIISRNPDIISNWLLDQV